MKRTALVIVVMTAVIASGARAWAAGTACANLVKLKVTHDEVTSAAIVAKGAFTPPPSGTSGGGKASPIFAALPSFCRVSATLRPSADSDIKMEIWMPAEGWNGRLQVLGNNGWSDAILYDRLAQGLAEGYAISNTNTGHVGNSGDALIGHPEKVKDWGYRAVHEDVVASRLIIAAHYGTGPKYSYYNGCSTGGRQGWVAAEYYPKDFDGLVIGDPANPMTRLQESLLWTSMVLYKDESTSFTPAKWKLVHDAVMEQCDAVDGLKDGLVGDPMACHFDPKSLVCKNGDAPDCLTAGQADALTKVLHGAVNSRTGEQFFPAFPPGTQILAGPLEGKKSQPQIDAIDTFRVIYQKPNWDYHTLDFDKDIAASDKLADHLMNAVDGTRLKQLFDHGGKMLLYHGWIDPVITPLLSVQLYNNAVAGNGGLNKTDNEIRLFLVPGMAHCGGGPGPNTFDKMEPLTAWVEHGMAPDQIIASHSTDGKVDRTRPLCPYPQIAKYKGTGSIDEAANFVCASP